jgi:starch-binding outer membrane protein, SusD/RagB family
MQEGRPVFGKPLTLEELLTQAAASFDSAAAYADAGHAIGHLARVGKARALAQLDDLPAAAAAVANVPTDFRYYTYHSEATQRNAVFQAIVGSGLITVADREGRNGLDFRSAADPRVPTRFVRVGGLVQPTDIYNFEMYPTAASPMVLASGVEARLIEAEAALRKGNVAQWLGILNDLRTAEITPAMAPLTAPDEPQARVDLLFRERAFWLFGTGHRHGDLRRLIRQYGRAAGTVFPTGDFREGRVYRDDVLVFYISGEEANPHFLQCIDLGA